LHGKTFFSEVKESRSFVVFIICGNT
jgi:hypothetical protein